MSRAKGPSPDDVTAALARQRGTGGPDDVSPALLATEAERDAKAGPAAHRDYVADSERRTRLEAAARETPQTSAKAPRGPVDEGRVIRLVMLTGFLACITGLVVALGLLVAWWLGFLLGVVAFGVSFLVLSHLENERQANEALRQPVAPAAGRRFDVMPPRPGGGQG